MTCQRAPRDRPRRSARSTRAHGAERSRRARRAAGRAALHVDRCFTLRGIGTVVTGTSVVGRSSARGRRCASSRARSAHGCALSHVHDERVPAAAAGQRVAAQPRRRRAQRDPARRRRPVARKRSRAGVLSSTRRRGCCRVRARCARGTRVHVHHGTRDTPARVVPLEAERFEPGTEQLVQLRLEQPLVPAAGRPVRAAPGRAARHDRRRVGDRPARAKARRRRRHTSSGCARSQAATRSRPCGSSSRRRSPVSGRKPARSCSRSSPRPVTPCGPAARGHAGSHRASSRRARAEVLRARDRGRAGPRRGHAARWRRSRPWTDEAVAALLDDLLAEGAVAQRGGVFTPAGAPACAR